MTTKTFQQLVDAGILEIGDGYRAKNSELGGDGLIFLRAGHVSDTHISFGGVERFHAELTPKLQGKVARVGDTVITTKGNSTGRTAFVTDRFLPFVYSPHLSYWRSRDVEQLESGFLRYWSRGAEFIAQLRGMSTSTDMAPYLSLTDQRRLRISIPPIQQQKRIAHILGTLDDKIELNRRMNATLEAMARALFQSWFVDFDPVRAKAAGQPPAGMNPATAALFPSEFEDSELGEIPKGWAYESVYKIAEVTYGAPFASSQFNENAVGRPLLRIRDLKDERPGVWTPEIHPKGRTIGPGDIVVGMDGEFRAYLWGGEEVWLNQRLCTFVPKDGYSTPFVINSIAQPLAEVEASETATTVIHLGKNDIDRFRVIVPTAQVAAKFGQLCQPLFDKIVSNKQMSRTLAALRDALLPKLLSGELRVGTTLAGVI